MRVEIGEQPAALRRTFDALLPQFAELKALARDTRQVLFIARGSSDNAAVYGQYLCAARAGRLASLGSPSLATAYHADLDLDGVLAVAVSQSAATAAPGRWRSPTRPPPPWPSSPTPPSPPRRATSWLSPPPRPTPPSWPRSRCWPCPWRPPAPAWSQRSCGGSRRRWRGCWSRPPPPRHWRSGWPTHATWWCPAAGSPTPRRWRSP